MKRYATGIHGFSAKVRLLPTVVSLATILQVAVGGLQPLTTAEASSAPSAVQQVSHVSRDCNAGDSTSSSIDGITFTFGIDVTEEVKKLIRDSVIYTRDYAERHLDLKLGAFDICAFGNADSLGESEATWLSRPEVLNERVTFWRTAPFGGVARAFVSSSASGRTTNLAFFSYTARPIWQQLSPDAYRHVAHEFFHLVQYQSSGVARDRGPTWLTEGTAELFGNLVLSESQGIEFSRIRNRMIEIAAEYTGTLSDLESQSVFTSASNVRYAYPLSFLASDSLRNSNDMRALVSYFKALSVGTKPSDAFIGAFGISLELFYERFAREVR